MELLAAGALGAMVLPGCSLDARGENPAPGEVPPFTQTTFFCLDTLCAVGGCMEERLLDEAVERCRFFEQKLSAHLEDSDVGRVNAAGGASVQVEPETARLVRKALDYSRESGGLFDITIGAVSLLWDFKAGVVAPDADIQRALAHVDYNLVEVGEDTLRLADPEARIDLGGIAKGFIADEIIAGFEEAGIASAFVNLGGNVKVLGAKEDGSPWKVGVRSPEAGSDSVVAVVESTGGSLVTSGLYERRFEKAGRSYWHILDPRTGYPVESGIVSASIYSQDSIDGDGFTKPLFMMGEAAALAFLEERGLDGLLIRADGSTVRTPAAPFTLV